MIKDRRIFITGGAGFIASTLISKLVDDNQIIVYDNFTRDTISKTQLGKHPNVRIECGDVLDKSAMKKTMEGCDTVIHAAGIAGIDTVVKSPVKTMKVNMIGTANTLECAFECGVDYRFVDFSTSEVFGRMAFRSSEEDETVSGSAGEARWTYAVSKLAGEHMAKAYHKECGLPVVTVRPFNVYGPGQTGEGAMQVFIRKALRNDPIEIHGDGAQIRAWCFVDDFVDCIMRCLTQEKAVGESFNIGNPRAVITVLGLAQTICRVLNSSSRIDFVPELSADVAIRIPSTRKCTEVLGFSARVDLDEGIVPTAQWIDKNL